MNICQRLPTVSVLLLALASLAGCSTAARTPLPQPASPADVDVIIAPSPDTTPIEKIVDDPLTEITAQLPITRRVGTITDSALREISGLAGSTRPIETQSVQSRPVELQPGDEQRLTTHRAGQTNGTAALDTAATQPTLWAINDSGNEPLLFAVSTQGVVQARFRLPVTNRDWESLSAVRYAGESWLVLADTGDNLEQHDQYRLHFIKEPAIAEAPTGGTTSASTIPLISDIRSVVFDYAALPSNYIATTHHNVEAMGVSAVEGLLYFVTRHATRALVFTLPLEEALNAARTGLDISKSITPSMTARFEGELIELKQHPVDQLAGRVVGVKLSQVTGLEFGADGGFAYVLTYRGVYRFLLMPKSDQRWFEVPPVSVIRQTLRQSEAIAIVTSTNGNTPGRGELLFFSSEKLPAPIIRLRYVPPPG